MNQYLHICTEVAKFNYLFEVIDYNYPNDKGIMKDKFYNLSNIYNEKQINLRYSLINEEIKELLQAIENNNAIEIIDALCDILYVVAGAFVYFNFKVVDDENYNYETPNKKNIENEDLEHIIERLKNQDIINLVNNITEQNRNLEKVTQFIIVNKNYNRIYLDELIQMYYDNLQKIVVNIFKLVNSNNFNINIIHQFDIVHSSNMSKICVNENDAVDSVNWYYYNEPRYKTPRYKQIFYDDKKYFIIFDADTGKIIKSIKYIPAKFI